MCVEHVHGDRNVQHLIDERALALDGKRLRGSQREETNALHVVILVGVRVRQVWGQHAVQDGDERRAAIAVLEACLPEGMVISADASLLHAPAVQNMAKKGSNVSYSWRLSLFHRWILGTRAF